MTNINLLNRKLDSIQVFYERNTNKAKKLKKKLTGEKYLRQRLVNNDNFTNLNKYQNLVRKQPRSYQDRIVDTVSNLLQAVSRGQLIMPCGTGKTLTSLWIHERLQPNKTLVLFPTLALLRQTKNEWKMNCARVLPYLCVCSEADIDKGEDNIRIQFKDVDSRVSSSPGKIRSFLEGNDSSIIYSTYQSLPYIINALKDTDLSFDVIFCDEAHKTAGLGKSSFKLIHDNTLVPAAKRLYMTATPKTFKIKSQSLKINSLCSVATMDNAEIFGERLCDLSLREVIDMGILVDFKLVVVGIEEEEIAHYIKSSSLSKDVSMEDAVHNYAVQKFMKEWKARNVITFHSSIKKAKQFKHRHQDLFPDVKVFHVNGGQTSLMREITLKNFARTPGSIVTNSKCLTEGIDVPAIDAVVFCNPKNSFVDIGQALGRVLRRADDLGKQCGYIVVPTLHVKNQDIDEEIKKSRFKNLLRVITAINNCDNTFITRLTDQLSQSSIITKQNAGLGNYQEEILEVFSSDIDFGKYLYTHCLELLPKAHVSLEEVRQWVRENGEKYGINSEKTYQAAHKAGLMPSNFPFHPYILKGFKGYRDFFGKKPRLTKENMASLDEVRQWVRKNGERLGINSNQSYQAAYKTGQLPDNFPSDLRIYEEFEGVSLFFDKKPRLTKENMASAEEVRQWIRENGEKYGINSGKAYQAAYKKRALPGNFPFGLRIYEEFERVSLLFGKRPKLTKEIRASLEEVRQWMRKNGERLGINSSQSYQAAYKTGQLPGNFPYDLRIYEEFGGYCVFFGKRPKLTKEIRASLEEVRQWMRKNGERLGINSEKTYQTAYKTGQLPGNFPFGLRIYEEFGGYRNFFDKD